MSADATEEGCVSNSLPLIHVYLDKALYIQRINVDNSAKG